MQCNIDARGKAARLIAGLVAIVIAIALAGCVMIGWIPEAIGFPIAGLLALIGGFGVFEGWKGWCAVRAMGFRTPL